MRADGKQRRACNRKRGMHVINNEHREHAQRTLGLKFSITSARIIVASSASEASVATLSHMMKHARASSAAIRTRSASRIRVPRMYRAFVLISGLSNV